MSRISESRSSWWMNMIASLGKFPLVRSRRPNLEADNLGAGENKAHVYNPIYLALATGVGLSAIVIELALVELGGYLCFAAIIVVAFLLSQIK